MIITLLGRISFVVVRLYGFLVTTVVALLHVRKRSYSRSALAE